MKNKILPGIPINQRVVVMKSEMNMARWPISADALVSPQSTLASYNVGLGQRVCFFQSQCIQCCEQIEVTPSVHFKLILKDTHNKCM